LLAAEYLPKAATFVHFTGWARCADGWQGSFKAGQWPLSFNLDRLLLPASTCGLLSTEKTLASSLLSSKKHA